MARIEQAAASGDPDAALGGAALSALMSSAEAMPVDLGRLSERADAERDRLTERLADSCARIDPGRPALEVARELVRDHPDTDGVIEAARMWTSGPSTSPASATWCPTPTASAWSGWRRSRGAGRWP